MKIWNVQNSDLMAFDCPGCKCCHFIRLPNWSFNGNYDAPTVSPSILVNADLSNPNTPRCHSFLNDGRLQFLDDCTHELKGQTVELSHTDEE